MGVAERRTGEEKRGKERRRRRKRRKFRENTCKKVKDEAEITVKEEKKERR